jgi:hypothetical protein
MYDDDHCNATHGRLLQYDDPVWEPLLAAVGERLTGSFMWMHEEVLAGGLAVHAYKHKVTRRYLYLSEDGRAFDRAACGGFVEVQMHRAIEAALCPWWLLAGWEPEDVAAIRDAILRASELRLGGTIVGDGD